MDEVFAVLKPKGEGLPPAEVEEDL